MKIEESLNVIFNETPPPSKTSPLVDDDLNEEEAIKVTEKKNLENDIEDETLETNKVVNIKEFRNHPLENVIGNLNHRTLRSQAQNQSNFFYFISTIELKNVNEILKDESWIIAMQEELNQLVANDVWELREEMIEACQDRIAFLQELESMEGVTITANTAMFFKEMIEKEGGREWQLHDLGKEAKERAREIEMFVQNLKFGGSS
ncbi:hypothetical protein Tco_1416267 [Tanacetum coccineum]